MFKYIFVRGTNTGISVSPAAAALLFANHTGAAKQSAIPTTMTVMSSQFSTSMIPAQQVMPLVAAKHDAEQHIGSRGIHTSSSSQAPRADHKSEDVTSIEAVFQYRSVQRHPLDPIFHPSSVAVIGASEKSGSVGRNIMQNLLSSPFGGTVYPVNPKRKNVLGVKTFASLKDIPEKVDLAVICIPAPQVPKVIKECVEAGVAGAVVISAGFSEAGEQGKRWAKEMVETAHQGKMRLIGPNCLGVMNPLTGLNCTFAPMIAAPGKVAVITQSGALGTAVLDWAQSERVGFSCFASIGSMQDVEYADLIEYLGRDPHTESIILYMESIGDARKFINASRRVGLTKPIICIKVGRTEQGGKAAASHTGSMTGSDDVLDAVFKRCGVLRVDSIDELFNCAQFLAKQPLPQGDRLAIITNAGGPAALSVDSLVRGGGHLAEVSGETMKALDSFLPEHWSHGNPLDVLGDAPPERYAQTMEVVSKDPNIDGMLIILTPQAMSDPGKTAEVIKKSLEEHKELFTNKPVIASWMGGPIVESGRRLLVDAGVPMFAFPDVACTIFNHMHKYEKNLEAMYSSQPASTDLDQEVPAENREEAKKLLTSIRNTGRTILTEHESKRLLELYMIPTTKIFVARTEDEAVSAAEKLGYPVVVKIHSETITHKMDIGGVKLNIKEEKYVRQAFRDIEKAVKTKGKPGDFHGVTVQPMLKLEDSYEIIFGSNADAQAGPVVLFGMGGTYVEVMKDSVLGLPPLNNTLATQMIESTKIYRALKGFRGKKPTNLPLLRSTLVRFSQLVVDLSSIVKEIDINPLICSPTDIVALDARVVVYDKDVKPENIPRPAVRPYPHHYTKVVDMQTAAPDAKKEGELRIRVARIEDRSSLISFYANLSDHVLKSPDTQKGALSYAKAFSLVGDQVKYLVQKQTPSDVFRAKIGAFQSSRDIMNIVTRMCMGGYDQEIVLVTESVKADGEAGDIVAVTTYSRSEYDPTKAYLSVVVSDEMAGHRLGQINVEHLINIARKEGLRALQADIAQKNVAMHGLCEKLGFHIKENDDGSCEALYIL